jgi:hypothetical protein
VPQDVLSLDVLHSYKDQLYGAVCFSVINSIEKILRMSLVRCCDAVHAPWVGQPVLCMRPGLGCCA